MSDMVEVIRCKDCRWWDSINGIVGACRNIGWVINGCCPKTYFETFCAYAERRDVK